VVRAFFVAFWLLIFLLSFAQYVASSLIRGESPNLALTAAWSSGWLLWIVVAPFVMFLARRMPLQRGRLGSRVPIHLAASLLTAVLVIAGEFATIALFDDGFVARNSFVEGARRIALYRFHVYVLVYWAVLGVAHALDSYGRLRERELRSSHLETELVEARLATLRAQLRPHFLFNTLHSVQAMLIGNEPEGAGRMLTRLSDLLRLSLEESGAPLHPLDRELSLTRLYLEIQSVRFSDRIRVEIDVDRSLLGAAVPTLLLQPLVENAVEHALSVEPDASLVGLTVRRSGPDLWFVVEDDGPGLRDGWREGTGLGNTRRRLETQYGRRAELSLSPRDPRGLRVEIRLPYATMEPARDA
jgi:signal transduction histidine kinase